MRSQIFRPSPPSHEVSNDGNTSVNSNNDDNDDKGKSQKQQQQQQESQPTRSGGRDNDGCCWERVGNEQHPLGNQHHHYEQQHDQQQQNNEDDPFPFRPTPMDTAMLLQSAARSVLDGSTVSSSFSAETTPNASPANANNDRMDEDDDDGNSSLWMMDNPIHEQQQQQPQHRPSLQSLEKKTLAALPDEQDKRRFLGCLAAVLASSYDYDVLDEEHDDVHQAVTRAETLLFNQDDDNHDHAAVDEDETETEDIYDDDDDDNADLLDGHADDDENDSHCIVQEHPSLLEQTVSGSFEFSDIGDSSLGVQPPPPPQRTVGGRSSHAPPIHSSSSLSSSTLPRTAKAAAKRSSPPRQQHQQQQDRLLSKHANKIRLSRSRHLKRRYDVLTRLLLSSADYLMLEKSQAKAFVPMLAKLLVPKQQQQQQQPAIPTGKMSKQHGSGIANPNTTVPATPTNSTASSTTTFSTHAAATAMDNANNNIVIGGGAGGDQPPPWKKSTGSSATNVNMANNSAATSTSANHNSNNVDESSSHRRQQVLLLESLLLSPESASRQSFVDIAAAPMHVDLFPGRRTTATTTASTTTTRLDDNTGGIPQENEVIILQREISEIEHLQPFLESMTRGGAFRCLVLVLLQHLLTSPQGYDARIRHAFKTLGVIILVQDIMETTIDVEPSSSSSARQRGRPGNSANSTAGRLSTDNTADLVELATRRFESLEHWIAASLIDLSREQEKAQQLVLGRRRPTAAAASTGKQASSSSFNNNSTTTDNAMTFSRREQILRGIKVGAVGVAAASLFAVTAGLAAPAIATAAAALASGTAATAAAAAVLTSTPAVVSIFGVGGGTLVAYKMNRRTMGLTEFVFRKENANHAKSDSHCKGKTDKQSIEAELFSTICISGWLRDKCDFQRPWGVTPSNPWITNREELLQRFYTVHRPDHVTKCKKILKSWEGEEKELWNLLRQKYGRDPDTLFPLDDGPRFSASLTLEQKEVVDRLFVELGCTTRGARNTENTRQQQDKQTHQKQSPTPFERLRVGWNRRGRQLEPAMDSLHGPSALPPSLLVADGSSVTSSGFESISKTISMPLDNVVEDEQQHVQSTDVDGSPSPIPKHLATVWDYQANYGGELYTVRWESDLLTELCDSVTDLAFEVVTGGTAQLLKHTALSTLLSAIAWPYALVNAANMIDETWTLAVERSDEAGRELARSLLFSRAGNRPVTLVGFSFGARTIYSCLKELAKYQEKWTEYRERTHVDNHDDANDAPWGFGMNTPIDDEGSAAFYKRMREPASIVEDVVLMGLPNHLSLSSWRACRQVVTGRLVNCFSQKDLILSLMFQFKRMRLVKPVCGTCPVAIPGVENIDVSDLVSGHIDYCMAIGDILKRLRFQQPFRSRPAKAFATDASPDEEDVTLADKFDV